MNRELWLLRHGKSDRDAECADLDRPLKPRGRRAARKVGAWLSANRLIPDRVVTSPALRALNTAQMILHALEMNEPLLQDRRLYFEGVNKIKEVLADCPDGAKRVLLVGHNPDFENLLIEFVGEENLPDAEKLMPTAALARLKMPADWTELESRCAELIDILYAKSLPD